MDPLLTPGSTAPAGHVTVMTHRLATAAVTARAEWVEAMAGATAPQLHPATTACAKTEQASRPPTPEQAGTIAGEPSATAAGIKAMTGGPSAANAADARASAKAALPDPTEAQDDVASLLPFPPGEPALSGAASDTASSSSPSAAGGSSIDGIAASAPDASRPAADPAPQAPLIAQSPSGTKPVSARGSEPVESDRQADPQRPAKAVLSSLQAGTDDRRTWTTRVQKPGAVATAPPAQPGAPAMAAVAPGVPTLQASASSPGVPFVITGAAGSGSDRLPAPSGTDPSGRASAGETSVVSANADVDAPPLGHEPPGASRLLAATASAQAPVPPTRSRAASFGDTAAPAAKPEPPLGQADLTPGTETANGRSPLAAQAVPAVEPQSSSDAALPVPTGRLPASPVAGSFSSLPVRGDGQAQTNTQGLGRDGSRSAQSDTDELVAGGVVTQAADMAPTAAAAGPDQAPAAAAGMIATALPSPSPLLEKPAQGQSTPAKDAAPAKTPSPIQSLTSAAPATVSSPAAETEPQPLGSAPSSRADTSPPATEIVPREALPPLAPSPETTAGRAARLPAARLQAASAAQAVPPGPAAGTPAGGLQAEADAIASPTTVATSTAAGSAGTTATAPSPSSPGLSAASSSLAPSLPATAAAPRPAALAKAATTDHLSAAAPHAASPTRSAPATETATATSAGAPVPSGATTVAAPQPATMTGTQVAAPTAGTPASAMVPGTPSLLPALGNAAGVSASSVAGGSPTAVPAAAPTLLGYTPATPDGMAASIVAMYRSGQSSLVLRLDPPGLGTVSVHVALAGNANVNVLFVPAVPQTAHLLQTGLGDLRQAMAASGLILGQAQIGGGASGGAGGGGASGSNPEPRPGTIGPVAAAAATPAEPARPETANRGARAIA